jgi:hypothetical protein
MFGLVVAATHGGEPIRIPAIRGTCWITVSSALHEFAIYQKLRQNLLEALASSEPVSLASRSPRPKELYFLPNLPSVDLVL